MVNSKWELSKEEYYQLLRLDNEQTRNHNIKLFKDMLSNYYNKKIRLRSEEYSNIQKLLRRYNLHKSGNSLIRDLADININAKYVHNNNYIVIYD